MATLLPVDPRASILYGGGNSKITDDEIRAYIKTPGVTDRDVLNKALEHNVSANQISKAMGGNPMYSPEAIDKYVASQGISRDQFAVPEAAATPAPVKFNPITVGPTETVQGHLTSILGDTHNPLNVRTATLGTQYANKRGMLNSSIGADAAVGALIDRATPIASQDASTNFAAKQQNAQGALTADTFNADVASRTNMFNTGAAKDIYTANIDTQNKLAIANIQAMAQDSGIMGDLGKTYMTLYAQVAADPNMKPDVKTATLNNLNAQLQGLTGLLPSINTAAASLKFSEAKKVGGSTSDGEIEGGNAGTGGSNKYAGADANILGYQVEPATLASVAAYEKATGDKIDRSRIAPEALVRDIGGLGQFKFAYLSSDGTTKSTNPRAYDIPALLKKYEANSLGELFNKMFVTVHPPGTMRADSPMFYLYR